MFAKRLALIVAFVCIAAGTAFAAVPPMVSYQGKLMQPSGAPVPDGTYSIQFAIYDVPTGGSSVWSETNANVQVKGGLFSVLLGSVINLPANIFDSPNRWFGVRVGSDPEMTPRQKIASVGYAIKAGSADVATTVPDASITTTKVASAAITTDRLAPAAVTADKLAPGVAIPPGTILMWSGAVNQIPQGWALCNGQDGTPDLGSKFIVGVGGADNYTVGSTGGLKEVTLTVAQMPSHNHWTWCGDPGNPQILNGVQAWATDNLIHKSSAATQSAGGDQPHENRPPYYALCFIMKLGY